MSLCSAVGPELSVTSHLSSRDDGRHGRMETMMGRGCFEIGEGKEDVCIVKWLLLAIQAAGTDSNDQR